MMGGVTRLPGGRELGYAEITSNATATTTVADVTGLGLATITSTRPIIVEAGGEHIRNDTALSSASLQIYEPTLGVLAFSDFTSVSAAAQGAAYCRRRLPAGTYTFKARLQAGVSGNALLRAQATSPGWIQVTEI